jgi:hypothetical protein
MKDSKAAEIPHAPPNEAPAHKKNLPCGAPGEPRAMRRLPRRLRNGERELLARRFANPPLAARQISNIPLCSQAS